jgi:hypothetical protein
MIGIRGKDRTDPHRGSVELAGMDELDGVFQRGRLPLELRCVKRKSAAHERKNHQA